jgi:hypothetical protein
MKFSRGLQQNYKHLAHLPETHAEGNREDNCKHAVASFE